MRGKGINYDTGFYPAGNSSRPDFDPAIAAQEMRGSLTVHSDGPGHGATFTLELPYLPAPQETT